MIQTGTQGASPEGAKSKIDKRNFMFVNLTEQEVMKKPGEVNGNPFKIAFNDDCTIWVLDYSAQVNENLNYF
jgi:tRNA(Glu) U13 pseudouridine synthase TruD